MHPLKAITIGILAWPAAEIVAFFVVTAAVGFGNALLLVVLMSVAGFVILRHFGGVRRVRTADGGFIAASALSGPGMAPGLGGLLLLIPGFLTSALAVLILFPLSRRWLTVGIGRLLTAGEHQRRTAADPGVIDLAPDEWRPLSGTKLPPAGGPAENQNAKHRNQR
jgi:UPF0716 protein FxsA